jgi:hypothetical protein
MNFTLQLLYCQGNGSQYHWIQGWWAQQLACTWWQREIAGAKVKGYKSKNYKTEV